MKLFPSKKGFWAFIMVAVIAAYAVVVYAAAPSGGYQVTDHELDPDCAPGDVDCFVVFPTGGGSGWALNGNTGTDGGVSDFIGTTDSQDFVIRVDDAEIARFGQVGNIATGLSTYAPSYGETSFGVWGVDYTPASLASFNVADRLFSIANGADSSSRHQAFVLFKDGTFVYGDDNLTYDGTGDDESKFFFDMTNSAIRMGSTYESGRWDGGGNVGPQSIALGFSYAGNSYRAPLASGRGAIAIGANIAAIGDYSVMLGRDGSTNGTSSFAFNGVTAGEQAVAFMANADAEGNYAFAVGSHAEAYSAFEVALGRYNTLYSGFHGIGNSPNTTDWESDDRLLVVGDGSSLATSDAFTILKSGEVCIAIDQCQDNSNGEVLQIGDGADNIIGYVNSTTGAYVATSDRRFKENIQDLPYGLGAVMALKPVQYDFIRNHEHSIGFIAQDVQEVVPEVVFGSEEKGYGIAYQSLTPVLVKAIQELNLKIQNIEMISGAQNVDWMSTMRAWFADRANDISELFAKKVTTRELCITDDQGETCLTRSQINAILEGGNAGIALPIPPSGGGQIDEPQPEPQEQMLDDQDNTPPEGEGEDDVESENPQDSPVTEENPA